MNPITEELRAIEARLDALCSDPGTVAPQTTQVLLRSARAIVLVARWEAEDHEVALARTLAGDGNDL